MDLEELARFEREADETPISEENIEAIKSELTKLPEGPSSISICADLKCNLKCPSCRNDYIVKNTPEREEMIESELSYILKNKKTIQTIKMSSGGEVLFSKDQRKLLKSLNNYDYPRLDHVFIITNGLLLNQKTFDELYPGSSFIKKVTISIDAGNEDTYKITRGGNWQQLMKNIDWISELKEKGDLDTLSMNFVVRKDNYLSIEDTINLARAKNFDFIEFVEFDNWNELYGLKLEISEVYQEQAVHLKTHPDHLKLISIFEPYRKDNDIRINIHNLFT